MSVCHFFLLGGSLSTTGANSDKASNPNLYDQNYYEEYNGREYSRTQPWFEFFGSISDNIISKLEPKTVLDVGCAYGILVETLRDRGIEAYGIDISDYAISQARPDLKDFLGVGSILKPLRRRYDLIVCIEVIEHIEEKDCDIAIKNMCNASDQVIIASIPDDFDDPTHFNVQPPLYWVKKFAAFGFEPVLAFDAKFLTPYAMLFRRGHKNSKTDIQALFGNKKFDDLHYSRVVHQRNIQRSELAALTSNQEKMQSEIAKLEELSCASQVHIENLESSLQVEREARTYYEGLVKKLHSSIYWKLVAPFRGLKKILNWVSPIVPNLVVEGKNALILNCKSSDIGSWGAFSAKLQKNNDIVVKLKFFKEGSVISVPLLPVNVTSNNRSWLFKNDAGEGSYTVEIVYSKPVDLSFKKISKIAALAGLLRYRWRVGAGIIPALKLFTRFVILGIRGDFNGIFEKFWPDQRIGISSYELWLENFDTQKKHNYVGNWIEGLDYKPLVSIILPTYNSDLEFLSLAVASVKNQSYQNWQLCIADDCSADHKLRKWLEELELDERIQVVFRSENGHISAASNSAIEMADGEFVTFLDHDDLLHPDALAAVIAYLNNDRSLDLIYTDEDKIDAWGVRSEPHFKPNWNPDLLLSQNYICHLAVFRRSIIEKINGMREGYEGAQDYDLVLRFTELTDRITRIPLVLYHWRTVKGSTALASDQKSYAHDKACLALHDAIKRRGIQAVEEESGIGLYHRVKYLLPKPHPLVSIIIPTRDRIELVKVCIDGILNKTNYKKLEIIIVDNDSIESESHDYFKSLTSRSIKVLPFAGEFNYSAINNFAVSRASGSVVVLLNNDIEVIDPYWLDELVSHAIRPEIGAVGGRLYYGDDHVQHDGIVIGIGGVAGYANPRMNRSGIGPFGGSRLIRNFSAVTAAALAVRKELFLEVGGLDETNLKVAFNDVDFCLRLIEAGYRNLFTPYCELYHHESLSRGPDTDSEKAKRFEKEVIYMKKKWSINIKDDPGYNPNLSLDHGFSINPNRGQFWPWDKP